MVETDQLNSFIDLQILGMDESPSREEPPDSSHVVGVSLCDSAPLLWRVEDLRSVRSQGLVGALLGSLPRTPRQNGRLGRPLLLLPEEERLLSERRAAAALPANNQVSLPAGELVSLPAGHQVSLPGLATSLPGPQFRSDSVVVGRMEDGWSCRWSSRRRSSRGVLRSRVFSLWRTGSQHYSKP